MMGEVSLETSPKTRMIQDMINSENCMDTTESTTQTYSGHFSFVLFFSASWL